MEYSKDTVHKDSGWGGLTMMVMKMMMKILRNSSWPQIAAPLPNSDLSQDTE
jgi:hypothetical protein